MASVCLEQSGNVEKTVETAVRESLPLGVGRRNLMVFELARALKAIPALARTDPRDLETVVRDWHQRALPFIGTKPFEETWIDFLRAWPRVKYPKGTEPMAKVFAQALDAHPPAVAERYEQPRLRLLVSLCRELQRGAGDGPFYLSVRTAAGLLGVDISTASRWLFLLLQDGILDIVSRGDQRERKASRFRYIAESRK
jgi:hypothetical protein